MSEVRVRMAPSPTGNLHLGTAYTTLFNYLFAKKNQGKFILRIEDTDKERNKPEFEENILSGLKWLGLNWDEGPYKQTERLENYQKASQKLLDSKDAYYCFCTPEELDVNRKEQISKGLPQIYSGKCRNLNLEESKKQIDEGKRYVVRLKMPEDRGKITWNDMLHGEVSFDSSLIGDTVIMRANGIPLYNFAVVVDDIDMKISHVLRGEDHISNTPKQIVLFEALGAKIPEFAHWPSILNPDRMGKLSKRNNATSVDEFKHDGYLSEALVNYMALIGWTMPDEKEIMSLSEMEQTFDIKKMRLSGAAFDYNKLDWINGEYIRKITDEELTKRLQDYLVDHPAKEKIAPVVPLIKERIKKLSDFIPLTDFLFEKPEYDMAQFQKVKSKNQKEELHRISEQLEQMKIPWDAKEFEEAFKALAAELGISNLDMFQLIRVAVSGQLVTPPLFESIQILGEEETRNRVKEAISFIENPPAQPKY